MVLGITNFELRITKGLQTTDYRQRTIMPLAGCHVVTALQNYLQKLKTRTNH